MSPDEKPSTSSDASGSKKKPNESGKPEPSGKSKESGQPAKGQEGAKPSGQAPKGPGAPGRRPAPGQGAQGRPTASGGQAKSDRPGGPAAGKPGARPPGRPGAEGKPGGPPAGQKPRPPGAQKPQPGGQKPGPQEKGGRPAPPGKPGDRPGGAEAGSGAPSHGKPPEHKPAGGGSGDKPTARKRHDRPGGLGSGARTASGPQAGQAPQKGPEKPPERPSQKPPETPPQKPSQEPPRKEAQKPSDASKTAGAQGGQKEAPAGEGFTRQVDREKGEGDGGIKRIAPTRAQDVIQEEVRKRTVDPSKVKLPQFPAPASERPQALQVEEQRREEIAAREKARREELLEGLDEEQRKKLEQDWEAQDKLFYKPDPADREVEIYEIRPPHAYVQIVKNERTHEMLYHAIEPKLSRDEQLLLDFIEETLVDVLDLDPEDLEKEELEEYIRGKFEEVLYDYSISLGDEESDADEAQERILYYVLRDFIGEGPINILMEDPMIEDISCDGPHVPVFVYHRQYEALTTTIRFADHAQLDSFVIRMAQRSGKHVSIAEPILDATMKDGSRLQATLAKEVSSFGSTFTIRKFREVPFTPIDLVRFGTMSSAMLAYLWMVIEHHMSGIYSGGTASGKTTAINALMMFIPPQNKVVTIEDTRELRVPEPNWIAGITRDGFGPRDAHGRQAGEIDMFQLLKNALRQRPEYIVVGEVRGAEAYNLFQAMATGHAAYGTMHADSVDAVIHRLESDPINIPRSLLEALDVVAVQIQTRVGGKRVRRTKQLTEIVGLDPNTREILTNEVFTWRPGSDSFEYSGISYALERIAQESGKTSKEVSQEMEDRVRLINHLVDIDLREYGTIAQVIKNYYKDKERVMQKVEAGEGWD